MRGWCLLLDYLCHVRSDVSAHVRASNIYGGEALEIDGRGRGHQLDYATAGVGILEAEASH